MIIFLWNGIFGCKPYVLLCIKCIVKTASCKALNRTNQIVLALDNACTFEFMNQFPWFCAIFCCIDKFCLSCTRNLHFRSLVYITICMSCDCDWFFPCLYIRFNSLYDNRSTKYCSIKNGTDRSIRTLPHFLQIIFCHSCCIRSDCCTFYGYTIFFGCFCRFCRNFIVRRISVFKSQIIVLSF